MTSEYEKWQKLKTNYLRQTEQALASTGHPKSADVLRDVDEHLDRKYAELPPDKQNWEGYQQILIDMGPPEEYAELLTEAHLSGDKTRFGFNGFLAVVFVVVLVVVGGYLVYAAKQGTPATPTSNIPLFESDERVLGKWVTVDFVNTIETFDPHRKSWRDELFLTSLFFEDNGTAWWTNIDGDPYKHFWTKGKVDPNGERPAFYYLKRIDGVDYLFFEWISGDVTERGMEPCYYVLTQQPENTETNTTQSPVTHIQTSIIQDDSNPAKEAEEKTNEEATEEAVTKTPESTAETSVIGKWVAVDRVIAIDDFNPNQRQYKKTLALEELLFIAPKTVQWTLNGHVVKTTKFNEERIESIDGQPASYCMRTIDGNDYLFVEWVTPDVVNENRKPDYCVFKRALPGSVIDASSKTVIDQDATPAAELAVTGKWTTVDFVRTIDSFKPGERQWREVFYLKGVTFYANGSTSGPWTWQDDTLWHPDDQTKAHFVIQQIDGGTYLFMEWMSGDVTIRGEKPWYYVLKKVSAASNQPPRKGRITAGASYCTADYVRSVFGQPQRIDYDGRLLDYPADGINFWFSKDGVVSEIRLNPGCSTQLETGISLSSTKQDVFRVYGAPVRIMSAPDLHRKNDERILYQKDNTSRIYYGQQGLIFWFRDDAVMQIVVFKGSLIFQ